MLRIVTCAGNCRMTVPGPWCRMGRLAAVAAKPVALGLVTAISAMMIVSSGPAAADQTSSLKSQAAQLSHDLVLEQLQIGAHQQQYAVDSAKVQQDETEIGST